MPASDKCTPAATRDACHTPLDACDTPGARRYSCTARALAAAEGGAASKRGLRIVAFHGAADRVIAASLAMRCDGVTLALQ